MTLLLIVFWFLVPTARDRTISPADLQGILGMIAHDRRTGFRGFPPFPAGLFAPRGTSQGTGRQVN